MTIATAKWTIADYHSMVAAGILAGRQVELLNGDIVEMPPEGQPHAYASDEAAEYLIYLLGDRAKVRQAKPVTLLNSNSEPEPDIAVVQRLGREYREHHPYPENIFWVIEYSDSSLSKDREVKSQVYALAGIREYWLINLRANQLIVFRQPTQQGYQSRETFSQGYVNPLAFRYLQVEIRRLLGM
ncbi:MAG: Uma2 family endonuclease [Hormoscilla sp.]